MKTLAILIVSTFILSFSGLQAQSFNAEKTVTHFYIVNVDQNLLNNSNSSVENDANPDNESLRKETQCQIMDSIYFLSSQMFRNELGLEFLPLNELKNKISYNSNFPNCPDMINIKKVLKRASGYKYYADYYVNIYSGYNDDQLAKSHIGQVKPLYAICFTLYDNTGRIIKKIDFSYKSKVSLVDNKTGDARSNEEIKTRLCHIYKDAFKEFSAEYKKILVAKI